MSVVRISSDQTIPLRQKVLRPGSPVKDCQYPGDSSAVHFGFESDFDIVAILSVYRELEPDHTDGNCWRIRGVATEEVFRGKGFASQLLQAAELYVKEQLGSYLWCNARTNALKLYEFHGYEIDGSSFTIAGIGEHYRVKKYLD